jgi:hypothetical protein
VTSADFQASDCSAYNVCTTTFLGMGATLLKTIREPARAHPGRVSPKVAPLNVGLSKGVPKS